MSKRTIESPSGDQKSACQSTTERLATYLALRMLRKLGAGRSQSSAPLIVRSPISRRDFAGFLGTTVETVSRNVQSLSRHQIIRIVDSGTFEILDPDQLIAASGQSEDDLRSAVSVDSEGDVPGLRLAV